MREVETCSVKAMFLKSFALSSGPSHHIYGLDGVAGPRGECKRLSCSGETADPFPLFGFGETAICFAVWETVRCLEVLTGETAVVADC